jgi:chemotaxis protein CheD
MLTPRTGLARVDVLPGEHYAAATPVEIKTLLGSCVAACLYDPVAGVAGLNHFLLAAPRYARSLPFTLTDAGRYGIHAMELLIADMQKLGAARSRLQAKVFGGASVLGHSGEVNFLCVSEVNVRFIREYLSVERIPVLSEDLGGSLGRVIHFRSDDFRVYRRFIRRHDTQAVEAEEEAFWKASIEARKPDEGEAILF